jgi:hypothetical protein
MTEAPVFGGGEAILAWFASQRPLDRLDLITRIEGRQRHYHALVLALKAVHAPPVTDAGEAQKMVALEALYRTTLPLLQAEHLALRSSPLSTAERATLERHKSAFRQELLYLAPLMREGYWAPLKQRWRSWIETGERQEKTASVTATDPWERIEQRMDAKEAVRPAVFDTRRARAILDLIIDRTTPVNPLTLDPDPLIPI